MARQCNDRESNSRSLDHKSDALQPLHHRAAPWCLPGLGRTVLVLFPCVRSRWKDEELEDKIHGEERMLFGEMKFPEFMFKPSKLTYNVSLYCDTPGITNNFGYTVLQRAVCVPCLPGTFFDPRTGNCTRCPLNTYQDQLAARSCTRCHESHYTRRVGMYYTLWPVKRCNFYFWTQSMATNVVVVVVVVVVVGTCFY